MIEKLLLSLRRINIYILVVGPIILSLLLLGLLLFAGDRIYGDNVPEVYQAASGVVFLFVASFSRGFQVIDVKVWARLDIPFLVSGQ